MSAGAGTVAGGGEDVDALSDDGDDDDEARIALGSLFLLSEGDRATVRLLMRGMPAPCTFGFPGTTGDVSSNLVQFCYNFHPVLSTAKAHPLHPFTRKERFFVYCCAVVFNVVVGYLDSRYNLGGTDPRKQGFNKRTSYHVAKNAVTILYAVLIRQLVICPCYFAPVFAELQGPEPPNPRNVVQAGARLRRVKTRGDQALLILWGLHMALVVVIVAVYYAGPYRFAVGFLWRDVAISELLNFFGWFLRFAPFFALLYPIHRAAWFQGGSLCDYVQGRKDCCLYTSSAKYLDASFSRCVEPDTTSVPSAELRTLFHKGPLSTWNPAFEQEMMQLGERARNREAQRGDNNTTHRGAP